MTIKIAELKKSMHEVAYFIDTLTVACLATVKVSNT